MFKEGLARERLEAMLRLVARNKHVSPQILLNAADTKDRSSSKNRFQQMVTYCFKGWVKSIIPSYEDSPDEPDFILYFSDDKKINDSIRGIDLPVKVLQSEKEIDVFRQGAPYKRLRGMVVVMQMLPNITTREFRQTFFGEIRRINDILYPDKVDIA